MQFFVPLIPPLSFSLHNNFIIALRVTRDFSYLAFSPSASYLSLSLSLPLPLPLHLGMDIHLVAGPLQPAPTHASVQKNFLVARNSMPASREWDQSKKKTPRSCKYSLICRRNPDLHHLHHRHQTCRLHCCPRPACLLQTMMFHYRHSLFPAPR